MRENPQAFLLKVAPFLALVSKRIAHTPIIGMSSLGSNWGVWTEHCHSSKFVKQIWLVSPRGRAFAIHYTSQAEVPAAVPMD